MREVKSGSQFRKDLKRYKNDTAKLEKLYDIVGYLERCEDIPKEFKPHMLTGDYAGHMECHVENCSGRKRNGRRFSLCFMQGEFLYLQKLTLRQPSCRYYSLCL